MKMFFLGLILVLLISGCTQSVAQNNRNDSPAVQEIEKELESREDIQYSGQLLAGSITPYLRYSKADMEKAKSEGKAIYIYFYATWCPICAAQRPSILQAFNEFSLPSAVGFEANWNDGQNTQEDDELARTYGVSYQHTALFLDKNGNLVSKSLSALSKEQIEQKLIEAGAS